MPQVPPEVVTATRISSLVWVLILGTLLITGQWWQPARNFRSKMLRLWKPSLGITLLYALSMGIGGLGFSSVSSIAKFCQAMIGLAIAYSIADFEPLPVTQAMVRREHRTDQIAQMLAAAVAIVFVVLVVANGLPSLLVPLFRESTGQPQGIAPLFPPNAWQSFFLLLAGAGIAEETLYRLVSVSLFWRLTHRRWLAITISALLFGAYHLSPLDAAYRQYWERPISIFITSAVMGIVMGYVYLKRGYETALLGHTLGDWVPLLLSRAA